MFDSARLGTATSYFGEVFMNKLSSKQLKAGMVVARDILTKQGQTIARAGTVLTAQLIAKLSFYRIAEVFVEEKLPEVEESAREVELVEEEEPQQEEPKQEEPKEEKKEPEEPVKKPAPKRNETIAYSERLKATPQFQEFSINYSRNIAALKTSFKQIVDGEGSKIDKNKMLKEAETLFSSRTSLDLFDMLHNMRTLDDTTYAHSVNVALVARAIGKWLKMRRDELNTLTIAGLLHDIGKICIPEEVLNKTGKLTDEEFAMIRRHPAEGYSMLKKVPGIDRDILDCAIQHHERFDGSGYPNHLPGEQIEDMPAIIAIADVYDAMTATRSYRAPKSAFQVIAAFENDGLHKYNPRFILTFLQNIANAYQNNRVILSDGTSARIIYINQSKLSRPMVQLDSGAVIDLSRQPDLEITKCL